ncbi:hypothetical protein LP419_08100 [Massilia sp. H-1]|nr:hypothetical protein LP419_08100 [Massilia sp. H-1]
MAATTCLSWSGALPRCALPEPNEDFTHQHQNVRKEDGKQFGDLPEYNDYNYIANVARECGGAGHAVAGASRAAAGANAHGEAGE